MKYLFEKWKEVIFIAAVVAAALQFYGLKVVAEDAQKKVGQFEQAFQKISQIAESLSDKNTWLRQYLENHGIDSAKAKQWSQYPKGVIKDSAGNPIPSVPYLDAKDLPEIGIYQFVKSDGKIVVIDTLWNFWGAK